MQSWVVKWFVRSRCIKSSLLNSMMERWQTFTSENHHYHLLSRTYFTGECPREDNGLFLVSRSLHRIEKIIISPDSQHRSLILHFHQLFYFESFRVTTCSKFVFASTRPWHAVSTANKISKRLSYTAQHLKNTVLHLAPPVVIITRVSLYIGLPQSSTSESFSKK